MEEQNQEIKVGAILQPYPDLYVKKLKKGWRQIKAPVKKDFNKPYSFNNINWKNLLLGGTKHFLFNTLPLFALIFLLIFSYKHDVNSYLEFFSNDTKINQFCMNRYNVTIECTPDLIAKGLCVNFENPDLSKIGSLIVR